MSKDVWVTGYNPNNPKWGAGYGGFMARLGLANATFGKDRVGVWENRIDFQLLSFQTIFEIVNSYVTALRQYGEPNFIISGWQDYGGTDIVNYAAQYLSSNAPPVKISVTSSAGAYNQADVVVEPIFFPSGIKNEKTVIMNAIPNIVTLETLLSQSLIAQTAIPLDIENEDFMTVMVGGPQKIPTTLKAMGRELAEKAIDLADQKGLNLIFITSPRTLPRLIEGINLKVQDYIQNHGDPVKIHLYQHIIDDPMNPYPGILGLPRNRLVIVTRDSLSLLSEAMASPVPVAIFSPWQQASPGFQAMFDNFRKNGFAPSLEDIERLDPGQWESGKKIYNTTLETAQSLRKNLIDRGFAQPGSFPTIQPISLPRIPYQPHRQPGT